ncbi:MAG: response regulator, partial [Candidatus Wallbacteria bacterium]|nr:response regulator [Candidatus Wallbacteria bacterium]
IRDVGFRMLNILGQAVDVAADSQEALDFLEAKQYDLMITDVGMPGLSGWELAQKIQGRYQGMKVAIVTGWEAAITEEQKQNSSVDFVLGKPLRLKDLTDLINEVLRNGK